MSRLVVVLSVVTLLAAMGGAMAAGATGKPLPPVVSGKVLSVHAQGQALQSFVLLRPSTFPAKHRRVTIDVGANTKYVVGKQAGTSRNVKPGETVLVRLSSPLKNDKGEATRVVIRVAAAAHSGSTATTNHATSKQHTAH